MPISDTTITLDDRSDGHFDVKVNGRYVGRLWEGRPWMDESPDLYYVRSFSGLSGYASKRRAIEAVIADRRAVLEHEGKPHDWLPEVRL